MLNKDSILY